MMQDAKGAVVVWKAVCTEDGGYVRLGFSLGVGSGAFQQSFSGVLWTIGLRAKSLQLEQDI